MTEYALTLMLKDRYQKPAWALLPQVRNGTGFSRQTTRTADAVAMSLYPSRGIHLHGFEIKVSRTDWQKELREPDKAESICSFCNFWWIVAPEEIVRDGELPPTWGLLTPTGQKLAVKSPAPELFPRPLDLPMIASLFRSAQECVVPEEQNREAIEKARADGYELGKKSADSSMERIKRQYDELKKNVLDFENKAGLSISGWGYGNISEVIRFLNNGGIEGKRRDLESLASKAESIAVAIKSVIAHSELAGVA